MGDYLIILAFDDLEEKEKSRENVPRLFAVDLRDLSVQQVQLDEWKEENPWHYGFYDPKYLLQKHNENQILVFDVNSYEKYRCSHMLTIESFQRKTLFLGDLV